MCDRCHAFGYTAAAGNGKKLFATSGGIEAVSGQYRGSQILTGRCPRLADEPWGRKRAF
jgi:hypothetical protein